MRLRHLFEGNAGGLQTIGICYGRFNPPHKGHRHVWEECAKNPVWFVGTNKNTGGSDAKNPLPYDVKLQCMEAVWPEVAGHVIPEQDLFVMAAHIYAKYGEHVHLKVYTDEQWLYAGLVKSNSVEQKHGYFKFANITHEPTQRLASATDLRKAVREGDQESFYHDMGVDPGTAIRVGKQSMSMFDVVAHYLNQFPVKSAKVAAENTEEKKKKWSDYGMPEPVEQKPKEKRFHGWDEFAHEKEKKKEQEVAEANPNQQLARYNPNGSTYRGTRDMPILDPNDPVHHADRFGPEHDEPYTHDDDFNRAELKRILAKHLSKFDERSQAIIKARFWDGMTYNEIADEFGISPARARQIEMRILYKLNKNKEMLKQFVAETITGAKLQQGLSNIKATNKVLREMRAKEFLSEFVKPDGKMHSHHIDGSQGYTLTRDVGGYDRVYHLNRFMMAMGMADGKSKKPVDMDASSWYEKYNIAFPYSDIEQMMVYQAMATVPTDGREMEKRGKSTEPKDTNKVSPVAKPKRNKYGI